MALHVLTSRSRANVAREKTRRTHYPVREPSSYGQAHENSLQISRPRRSWRRTHGSTEPAPATRPCPNGGPLEPASPSGLGASAGICRPPRGSHRGSATGQRTGGRRIHMYACLRLPTLASQAMASGSASTPAGERKRTGAAGNHPARERHLAGVGRRAPPPPHPPPRARGAPAEARGYRLRLGRAPSPPFQPSAPAARTRLLPPPPFQQGRAPVCGRAVAAPAPSPGVLGGSIMAAPCGRFLHMG